MSLTAKVRPCRGGCCFWRWVGGGGSSTNFSMKAPCSPPFTDTADSIAMALSLSCSERRAQRGAHGVTDTHLTERTTKSPMIFFFPFAPMVHLNCKISSISTKILNLVSFRVRNVRKLTHVAFRAQETRKSGG